MIVVLGALLAFLSLVVVGLLMFTWLVTWLDAHDDRAASDPAKETPPKGWCVCGQPLAPHVFHRADGPCFHRDPRTAPTEPIAADPERRRTQRGQA